MEVGSEKLWGSTTEAKCSGSSSDADGTKTAAAAAADTPDPGVPVLTFLLCDTYTKNRWDARRMHAGCTLSRKWATSLHTICSAKRRAGENTELAWARSHTETFTRLAT